MASDTTIALTARKSFVDLLFTDPDSVPFRMKSSWLGTSVLQAPVISSLVITREQDPTQVFEAGAQGFPLMVLHGTGDRLVEAKAILEYLRPKFTNLEECLIDSSHTPFFDNQQETVDKLMEFALRVTVRIHTFSHPDNFSIDPQDKSSK